MAKRVNRIESAEVWIDDARLELDKSVWLDLFVYFGLYEAIELSLVARLLRRGDTCVDAGANVGVFTVLCATRAFPGRVFAFEPSPTFERLRTNVDDLRNVIAVRVGLSSSAGSLHLHTGEVDDVCATFRTSDGSPGRAVETVRLDDAIGESTEVDFLKIDVEGWESEVIEGAGAIWRERHVGIALIEANPQWGPIDYLKDAQGMGYCCFEVGTKGRLVRTLDLRPLEFGSLREQRNVLLVRPDRMSRLD